MFQMLINVDNAYVMTFVLVLAHDLQCVRNHKIWVETRDVAGSRMAKSTDEVQTRIDQDLSLMLNLLRLTMWPADVPSVISCQRSGGKTRSRKMASGAAQDLRKMPKWQILSGGSFMTLYSGLHPLVRVLADH